jgi:glutamate racemase
MTSSAPPSSTDHELTSFDGLRLGVFDSGLGGLSMLEALRNQVPEASVDYVADSGFAPYGERSDDFIMNRCRVVTEALLDRGAELIVVACNTATAVAIRELRHAWPKTPFIGVEPGIKPAITASASGRIGVLATPMTLASRKFRDLVDTHADGAQLTLQPCPGLAAEIEKGALDTPALRDLVARFCAPLQQADVDTVVLGCTHYPLIRPLFIQAMPAEVQILDTAAAVARHARRLAQVIHPPGSTDAGVRTPHELIRLWTTGDPLHLQEVARCWLGEPALTARRL